MSSNESDADDIQQQETTPGSGDTEQQEQEQTNGSSGLRAFTFKATMFGILGLLFTIIFTPYGDFYLKQGAFVSDYLPPGPFYLVMCLAVLWNPMWRSRIGLAIGATVMTGLLVAYNVYVAEASLLSWHWLVALPFIIAGLQPCWIWLAPRMLMSSRELIVVLIIIFAGCWTPGSGLNNFFLPNQMGSWSYYENQIQMHKYKTIEYVPADLWAGGGLNTYGDQPEERKRIYDAYFTGSEEQGLGDSVPWDAWLPTLLTNWVPMFFLFCASLVALSLIVHRQWAHHEQLAYPIAQIGTTLFDRSARRTLPNLFYNRAFWVGLMIVGFFHGIRLLHAWWPNNFPSISTHANFSFIWNIFPVLNKSGGFGLNGFDFNFALIGICYFLSREIGLTMGLSHFLLAIFGAQIYLSTGDRLSGDDLSNMRAGAYISYAAIILYTGRSYYWSVFKKALTFKAASEHEQDGVFAARILMASFTGLIIVLTLNFNIDLSMALLYSLTAMLLFIVFSRIVCETGIPWLQAGWQPSVLLSKMLGVSAIGATPLVMMYYLGAFLFPDPKESMIPYVANGLKMADDYKLKMKKLCTVILIIVGAAIFISICSRIYQQYTLGGYNLPYAYADLHVPRNFLRNSTQDLTQLEDLGLRSEPGAGYSIEQDDGTVRNISVFERIGMIKPDGSMLGFFIFGAVCVGLFFFLRFRYTTFPLHPVLFLIWGTYPCQKSFYSFLIGFFIRELVVRFGGGKIYQDLKPFFIGIICADLFMGMFGMTIGSFYHVFTGFEEKPPGFRT